MLFSNPGTQKTSFRYRIRLHRQQLIWGIFLISFNKRPRVKSKHRRSENLKERNFDKQRCRHKEHNKMDLSWQKLHAVQGRQGKANLEITGTVSWQIIEILKISSRIIDIPASYSGSTEFKSQTVDCYPDPVFRGISQSLWEVISCT